MRRESKETNRRRKQRQRRELRQWLLDFFGSKCALCPETDPEKLEFDHVNGRDYDVNKMSSDSRLRRYVREAKEGKGRLLCSSCNLAVRKTNDNGRHVPSNTVIPKTDDTPF